jgi:hypothetical protein
MKPAINAKDAQANANALTVFSSYGFGRFSLETARRLNLTQDGRQAGDDGPSVAQESIVDQNQKTSPEGIHG